VSRFDNLHSLSAIASSEHNERSAKALLKLISLHQVTVAELAVAELEFSALVDYDSNPQRDAALMACGAIRDAAQAALDALMAEPCGDRYCDGRRCLTHGV